MPLPCPLRVYFLVSLKESTKDLCEDGLGETRMKGDTPFPLTSSMLGYGHTSRE